MIPRDRDLLAWATYITLLVIAVILLLGSLSVQHSLYRIERGIGGREAK